MFSVLTRYVLLRATNPAKKWSAVVPKKHKVFVTFDRSSWKKGINSLHASLTEDNLIENIRKKRQPKKTSFALWFDNNCCSKKVKENLPKTPPKKGFSEFCFMTTWLDESLLLSKSTTENNLLKNLLNVAKRFLGTSKSLLKHPPKKFFTPQKLFDYL